MAAKKIASMIRSLSLLSSFWFGIASLAAAPTFRIYVLNYGSARVDVIDSATNKIVQAIEALPRPDGIAFSPDGQQVYISSNSDSTLDVIERKTAKIIKKIPLTGKPNNIAITKDGQRILICIRSAPGALDVVDAATLERVTSIPMKSPLHNVFVTPDGKFAVVGSEEGRLLAAMDLQTDQPSWNVSFDGAVRPMAFDVNPDGSTRRVLVQVGTFRGFAVVDFAAHKEVRRVELPAEPRGFESDAVPNQATSHGIAIDPVEKTIWVASATNRCVFIYSLVDLHALGYVSTGVRPDWVTLSPDRQRAYISNAGEGTLSVIDVKSRKEVARVPVGEDPRRIGVLQVH